jgi:hypothetical protein
MKLVLVGLWAVVVSLGTGYAVAQMRVAAPETSEASRVEGLSYTSLPTLSVPVVEDGTLSGYVVVRMVYTADAAVMARLAAEPDSFITDEIFRRLYGNANTVFGRLVRLDLEALAEEARTAVNTRLGEEVVQDLLVDGLNYIDLTAPDAAAAARATAAPALIPDDRDAPPGGVRAAADASE